MQIMMWNSSHTSVRQIQELEILPHWSTWTPLQGYSHTLDISGDLMVFRWVRALTCMDPVSRHWHTRWPIIFLEDVAPLCRSSPNFRRNSRCTDMIDLLNMNCSTQNRRCCTDQRSIVHWIQVHTDPNHRCQRPLPQPTQAYCQIKMGNVKCCTLYINVGKPYRNDYTEIKCGLFSSYSHYTFYGAGYLEDGLPFLLPFCY